MGAGVGQTPPSAGRHGRITVPRVRLEGGVENTHLQTYRREGACPDACRSSRSSSLQESFQHHSPRSDHAGKLVLCRGLPAAASGASFLPAQVTFAGQTCLCGAKKRPTRPCQAPCIPALEVSGHQCQDAASSKGTRGLLGSALNFPPTKP